MLNVTGWPHGSCGNISSQHLFTGWKKLHRPYFGFPLLSVTFFDTVGFSAKSEQMVQKNIYEGK